jgi:two-component system, response regulator PdtaR
MEPNVNQAEPIHVLFVEDEVLISDWVAQALSEQGFAVETVANAADALALLASGPVDVLFTDINLPGGMDGAALARRARELRPHLPVIYASARATLLKQDARVPGSIVVPKPYEPALVGRLLAAATKVASAGLPA